MQPKGPSLGERFKEFLANLEIDNRAFIISSVKGITKAFNQRYWGIKSDIKNTYIIGSYGRGTAIKGIKNINLLAVLPRELYEIYENIQGNGQNVLLLEIKEFLQGVYEMTHINEEGHLLVPFPDLTFEFIPTFATPRKNYIYPDIKEGGNWVAFNPVKEISVLDEANYKYNGKVKHLAKVMRAWKSHHDVPISGMLLDTLVLNFMEEWEDNDKSFAFYGFMIQDYLEYLAGRRKEQLHWYAKGSNRVLPSTEDFGEKANYTYITVRNALSFENEGKWREANKVWREIFGPSFPL